MSTLETKNLTKKFEGVAAVDNLSISIKRGKVTSIVGPNGSGKTTLINTLTGLLPKDDGSVYVAGVELEKVKPHQIASYDLTRTFQNVRLFEQMTVLDNILVVLTERNVWSAFFEKHKDYHLKEAEQVLTKVGLWDPPSSASRRTSDGQESRKQYQLAYNLSYGQRKLLEIARALSMKSDIYLLDEPFAGLFKEMVKLVAEIVRELRDAGKTIILVEHDMDLVRELSDHLIVMESGKLLAEGKPEEVLKEKRVVEAYLGV